MSSDAAPCVPTGDLTVDVANTRECYNKNAVQYEEMCREDWSNATDAEKNGNVAPTINALGKAIEDTTGNKGGIYDVGMGPGFNIEHMLKNPEAYPKSLADATIYGFDLSPEMVRLAGDKLSRFDTKIELATCNMMELEEKIASGTARIIMNLCCIQHFDKAGIVKTIQAAQQALSHGGVLLMQFWSSEQDGPMHDSPPGEVFMSYSEKTIESCVEEAGAGLGAPPLKVAHKSSHLYAAFEMSYTFFHLKKQ